MSYYSGNSGLIEFGRSRGEKDPDEFKDTEVKITSWTLNSSVNLLDTTTLSDWDKSSDYGIRTTTGTLTLLYYSDSGNAQESVPANNAASWFFGALARGVTSKTSGINTDWYQNVGEWERSNSPIPVRLRLYLRRVSDQYRDFVDMRANLTSVSTASTVNEITKVEVSFEADGMLNRMAI